MVYRIRFAKYGVMKFIGHLDVMRYFQKVVRRSGLPVRYSLGFTPHQIMSFALPLGLGITSDGEYMEIEFTDDSLTEDYILSELKANTTEGFEILGIETLPKPEPNKHMDKSMALVEAAEYRISFKDDYEAPFADNEELWSAFRDFYNQDEIYVSKKTKKSETTVNLKEYIYAAAVNPDDMKLSRLVEGIGREDIKAVPSGINNTKHADDYENGLTLFLRLAAGSSVNIKPELVLEAFYAFTGKEYDEKYFQIHRTELYKMSGGKLKSL